MWINKLPAIAQGTIEEAYVFSLRNEASAMVEIQGNIRITFIMDRYADGYIIVELLDTKDLRFAGEAYSFESTQHALTEWTAIVADYTTQNLFDKVREIF